MPQLTQTVEPRPELELTPQQRTKLQNRLLDCAKLQKQIDDLEEQLALKEADIKDIREVVGARQLDFPGYGKVTLVDGQRVRRLERKKLLAYGFSQAVLDECTSDKPKKPYVLITLPGDEKKQKRTDDDNE